MSNRIELEQISENEVEVVLPPETPMQMVEQLVKGLKARGLVEDLSKSTLSIRYFSRPTDKANTVADELIKSLNRLTKGDDELPYWHPKAQMANQKRVREMEIAERRAKIGMAPQAPVSAAPAITPPVPAAPAAPVPTAPNTLTPNKPFPKMVDSDPANQGTAGGSGKRYAYITDPVGKGEDEDEDDVEKSNYGPKGGGQYTPADNARRKSNNLDPVGVGPNVNAKAYSTKPGQMSGKAQANLTARIQAAANKKQPVRRFTPEEIEAENKKRGLKKHSWGQHLPFPSAEEEIMKLAGVIQKSGEESSAQQLANLLAGKKMLGDIPMGMRHMFNDPKPQPTNQEMFGHLEVTEEMAKKAETEWAGTLNNFFAEASKPLSQRFRSEEEELAYWNSIKVADKDDGKSGY